MFHDISQSSCEQGACISAQRSRIPSANVIEILPILYPCGKSRVSLGVIDGNVTVRRVRGRPPLDRHPTTAFQGLSCVGSHQTTIVPFHRLHLFGLRYESTRLILVVRVDLQRCPRRLRKAVRNQIRSASSPRQTTRKLQFCRCNFLSYSRTCTAVPRISRRWKDDEIPQGRRAGPVHAFYQHHSWRKYQYSKPQVAHFKSCS